MKTVEERFWSKVDRRGDDECWPWTGGTMRSGDSARSVRGLFSMGGKRVNAPRAAIEITTGVSLGPGLCALHSCDNPICVNPAHLRVGTQGDNQRERFAKGRVGAIHRPLNEEKVREIHLLLRRGVTQVAVASRFGVSPSTISLINTGRSWRSVWEEYHAERAA